MIRKQYVFRKEEKSEASLGGFAGLSDDDFFGGGTSVAEETAPAAAVVNDAPVDELNVTDDTPAAVVVDGTKDKKDEKDVVTPVGNEGTSDDTEEDDKGATTGFENPAEGTEAAAGTEAETEELTSFVTLGESLGIDIKEDSFDALKAAFDAKIVAEKEATKKEVPAMDLSKYDKKTQDFINFIEAGGSVEAFSEPTKVIDTFLALDDAELRSADLKEQGWEDDMIAEYIEKKGADGSLKLEAYQIRKGLEARKEEIRSKIIGDQINSKNLHNTAQVEALKKESESVFSELNKVSSFMDHPVSKQNQDHIAKKYGNGAHKDALKDPKAIAEFLIYKEFGGAAIAKLKQTSLEAGRDMKTSKLHNLPPVVTSAKAGGIAQNQNAKDPNGNWGALASLTELD